VRAAHLSWRGGLRGGGTASAICSGEYRGIDGAKARGDDDDDDEGSEGDSPSATGKTYS
jgi:hypothetical protein